jgi:hypothetical protein
MSDIDQLENEIKITRERISNIGKKIFYNKKNKKY